MKDQEEVIRPNFSKLLATIHTIKKTARKRQRNPSKEIADDIMQELEKIQKDVGSWNDVWEKETKLRRLFFKQGISDFYKLQEFSKAFPWFSDGETATGMPTAQSVVSSQTVEQYGSINGKNSSDIATDGLAAPTREHLTAEYVEDFINKLFAKDNNKVEYSDFQGLGEAVDSLELDYLKPVASKISKACGKSYDKNAAYEERFLLCAAVKEMEDRQGLEQVDEPTLLKWGATFNKAKEVGIQLDFFKRRLEEIARAYFGARDEMKPELSKSKAKLNMVEQCLRAAKGFEGRCLTDGMFPF